MGSILFQLEQLFIQTIPTVVLVVLLYLLLDRLFFRPLVAVLKKREVATTGALARAQAQIAEAEEKARQYEAAFQAARQEIYRQREHERRAILAEREATLKEARAQSEGLIRSAQASLADEVAQGKSQLQASGQALGEEVADTVLGRAALQGPGGGAS